MFLKESQKQNLRLRNNKESMVCFICFLEASRKYYSLSHLSFESNKKQNNFICFSKASKNLYYCVYSFKSIKESILFHLFFKSIKELLQSILFVFRSNKKWSYFIYSVRNIKEFILFCNLLEAIKNNYICFIVFRKYQKIFVLFHLSFKNNKNHLFFKKHIIVVSLQNKKSQNSEHLSLFLFWNIFCFGSVIKFMLFYLFF